MISTFLIAHPWLTTLLLVVVVALGPVAAFALARRPRAAWTLCAVSLVPVAVLTLSPDAGAPASACAVQWSVPRLSAIDAVANLVLFVPPALLAATAGRRPVVALLAGSGLSVLIELAQALVPALGRSCDTDDWLDNTTGAALGVLLALVGLTVRRLVERHRLGPVRG